jgi:hypothetical protein
MTDLQENIQSLLIIEIKKLNRKHDNLEITGNALLYRLKEILKYNN